MTTRTPVDEQRRPGTTVSGTAPEAPRGYRLTNGGGKNLERLRDISNGRGGKATAREARIVARLYFKAVDRLVNHDDEESEEPEEPGGATLTIRVAPEAMSLFAPCPSCSHPPHPDSACGYPTDVNKRCVCDAPRQHEASEAKAILQSRERGAEHVLMPAPAGMRCCKEARESFVAGNGEPEMSMFKCVRHGDGTPFVAAPVPCSCGAARYSPACSLLPEHPHVKKSAVTDV